MSAPPSGSASGSPQAGFYPDPSIPGYIRYWNGSAWVPGTSRPEPREGDPMPVPPAAGPGAPGPAPTPPTAAEPAPAEETGPVFLDEGQGQGSGQGPEGRDRSALPEVRPSGEVAPVDGTVDWDDPSRLHGQRPEPASAWGADAARQQGFAGQSDDRVSWGQHGEEGGQGGQGGQGSGAGAGAGTADPRGGWGRPAEAGRADEGTPAASSPATGGGQGQPPREGTFQMRALSPEQLKRQASEASSASGSGSGPASGGDAQVPQHTVGLRRSEVLKAGREAAQARQAQEPGATGQGPAPAANPHIPAQGASGNAPSAPSAQSAQAPAPQPGVPAQQTPPAQGGPQAQSMEIPSAQHAPPAQSQPLQVPPPSQMPPPQVPPQQAPQPSQQQAPQQAQQQQPPQSWAQQVHDLAAHSAGPGGPQPGGLPAQPQSGGPEAVTPWRPPVSDPFLQAAQQQARPAGLGKRFGARLVDGVLTAAVAAGVVFPFVGKTTDHIQGKIDAVRQSGETKEVWLIDGTTGGYLAIVLGALLVFGLLYEVLPTSRWGRTLGKKLFGLKVLDLEGQDKPGFRAALVRWLVYGVLSLVVVGVVNIMWCLFDRPWRQCWHDKAARTFVSRDSGGVRL
ncbi:RDD family protein [Streptomyces daliensis]